MIFLEVSENFLLRLTFFCLKINHNLLHILIIQWVDFFSFFCLFVLPVLCVARKRKSYVLCTQCYWSNWFIVFSKMQLRGLVLFLLKHTETKIQFNCNKNPNLFGWDTVSLRVLTASGREQQVKVTSHATGSHAYKTTLLQGTVQSTIKPKGKNKRLPIQRQSLNRPPIESENKSRVTNFILVF